MKYDVLVIGAGLSGLSAAALLSKRNLKVAVVDKSYCPGGSCGAFKREDVFFDQGSSMLFGWGERGFNAHRFLFNCLEEEMDVIAHPLLYCVHFKGEKINFHADIDLFIEEVARLFPSQKANLKRFYADMEQLYTHVMVENPNYTTPDETDRKSAVRAMLSHPVSYIRFLSYLNKSAKSLLSKYFTDPDIFSFFDKLTSTYCYTTVEESPAILSSVMFVDNHVGGSYYPAGSSLMLPGKLEKVIEEQGSEMIPNREVVRILFSDNKPNGVLLDDGSALYADQLIYCGTVWNLYGKLIPTEYSEPKRRAWAARQVPTYPSVVLYSVVDRTAVDADALAVEMLVGDPSSLNEEEVTVYIPSVDDHTICGEDEHVVLAIGPSFRNWDGLDAKTYQAQKKEEIQRLLAVVARRFPAVTDHVRYTELATPKTIERYTLKNGGAVAGPKQLLGNHMFKRLHVRTEYPSLFCCGESTVLGTGTPTVTTSGVAAANAVLSQRGLERFVHASAMKQYVHLLTPPYTADQLYASDDERTRSVKLKARRCQICEHPTCCQTSSLDVPSLMRRVMVGNLVGAKRLLEASDEEDFQGLQSHCIREEAVDIQSVCSFLAEWEKR